MFRLRQKAKPARPVPNKAKLAGSGTGLRWASPLYVVAPDDEAVICVVNVSENGLALPLSPLRVPLKLGVVKGPSDVIVCDVSKAVFEFPPDAV